MLVPTYSEIVRALCEAVVTEEEHIRIHGVRSKYRCKATYSLHPQLCTSTMTMDIVNDLCNAVNEFRLHHSTFSKNFPFFFNEVCGKVTRANELMLKVVFINQYLTKEECKEQLFCSSFAKHTEEEPCKYLEYYIEPSLSHYTLWEYWISSNEKVEFVHYLQSKFTNLKTIVAHVRECCESVQELSCEKLQEECNCNNSSEEKNVHSNATSDSRIIRVKKHFNSSLSLKPDKLCSYVSLTEEHVLTITEYTPNNVPFRLSADAFCEINHEMETAIHQCIMEFLSLSTENDDHCTSANDHSSDKINAVRRHAIISGRDVNCVVKTYETFYDSLSVVTTCPIVYNDTHLNNIPCTFVNKWDLGKYFTEKVSKLECTLSESNHTCTECVSVHVLITAGRHGIHESTALTLVQLALMYNKNNIVKASHREQKEEEEEEQEEEEEEESSSSSRICNNVALNNCTEHEREHKRPVIITDLIYVSCNVVSLARDLHILKEGFKVHHIRTFDFFPGSSYVMTVIHLRPLSISRRGETNPLLIIPVGAPCVGKSICGRALHSLCYTVEKEFQEFAHNYMQQESSGTTVKHNDSNESNDSSNNNCQSSTHCYKKAKQTKSTSLHEEHITNKYGWENNSISRTPTPIGSHIHFTLFERDLYFHACRERNLSLKASRVETHSALMSTLQLTEKTYLNENEFVNKCNCDFHGSGILSGNNFETCNLTKVHRDHDTVNNVITLTKFNTAIINNNNCSSHYYKNINKCCHTFRWPARRIVYLDSTNGSAEARALYCSTWHESNAFNIADDNTNREANSAKAYCNNNMHFNFLREYEEFPTSSVLELYFATPSVKELLRRVRRRIGHPSFPESAAHQELKINNIVKAIEMNTEKNNSNNYSASKVWIESLKSKKRKANQMTNANKEECSNGDNDAVTTATSYDNDNDDNDDGDGDEEEEHRTITQVLVYVIAHLIFAPELASLFAKNAISLLQK